MNTPPQPCPPRSECWCELHPNNPSCANAVPIDDYISILLILGLLIGFFKLRKLN
jgi:hypothetical protein